MVRLFLRSAQALALLAVAGGRGHAGVCPPAVALTGEPSVVTAVRDQLDARGIAEETPSCPAVRARVERRGTVLVVGIERPGGPAIEREVSEPATAATVIESWTRRDVAEPLLVAHAVPPEIGTAVGATPPTPSSPSPSPQGIQLFAAEETSVASDHTVWAGLQLGACIMLGPICASARVHGGGVIARPARWNGFKRKGAEVYAGIDVPIAVGWTRLTLGFAAGYGSMFTSHKPTPSEAQSDQSEQSDKMGIEISGLRAEIHAALSLPLTAHIALDLTTTGELTQPTGMETHGAAPDPSIVFPAAPRALFRLAIGVRYGAL